MRTRARLAAAVVTAALAVLAGAAPPAAAAPPTAVSQVPDPALDNALAASGIDVGVLNSANVCGNSVAVADTVIASGGLLGDGM